MERTCDLGDRGGSEQGRPIMDPGTGRCCGSRGSLALPSTQPDFSPVSARFQSLLDKSVGGLRRRDASRVRPLVDLL